MPDPVAPSPGRADPADCTARPGPSAADRDLLAEGRPLVVGHSAACTLAWVAADRRPDAVTGVVLIGGFPTTDGGSYADFFETDGDAVAFPGWEPFAGPDSNDMSPELKAEFAAGAHPVPVGVTKGTVRWTDERGAA